MMFRKKQGFTLIELLVVIAIIAVLAAILFPVFAKAREQARMTSCLSNVKQIGTALQMYMQDHDQLYPVINCAAQKAAGEFAGIWYGGEQAIPNETMRNYLSQFSIKSQLNGYTKSGNIWKCPSDSGCDPNFKLNKRFSSYGYRHYLYIPCSADLYQGFRGSDYNGNGTPFSESDISKPSQTFAFTELIPFHDFRTHPSGTANSFANDAKINLAFMDGHAKTHAISKVWPGDTSTGLFDQHWPRRRDNGDAWLYVNGMATPWPDLDD